MKIQYEKLAGTKLSPTDLKIRRAIAFYRAISQSPIDTFLRCTTHVVEGTTSETIIAEISVNRPQRVIHEVQFRERVAVSFVKSDDRAPEVLALRKSFPRVPHLNLLPTGQPKSFCLYADEWNDLKLRWNANGFLERIREWLTLTSRGELHQDDQPLEPFLWNSGYRLILPQRLGNSIDSTIPLRLACCDTNSREKVIIAIEPNAEVKTDPSKTFLMIEVRTPPVCHGVIHAKPESMQDLAALLDRDDFSFLAELRMRLNGLADDNQMLSQFLLLLALPKKRTIEGEVEAVERKAFLFNDDVYGIGEKLDLWTRPRPGERRGSLYFVPRPADGTQVQVNAVLEVSESCSWNTLALLNNSKRSEDTRILAVGAGALGSQVICNLARSGYGRWTIVDNDVLLPHNMARHIATDSCTGVSKANLVSGFVNSIADDDAIAEPLHLDVLQPADSQKLLTQKIADSEIILDMSASVAVARRLSIIGKGKRIVSAFLNPTGNDLVALATDRNQESPIDHLEMLYYWAISSMAELDEHLYTKSAQQVRYGTSCRDLSSRIPQAFVALHAANGARALQRVIGNTGAAIKIYRYVDESMTLNAVNVPVEPLCEVKVGHWQVHISQDVLRTIGAARKEALPNETGGVLVGAIDFDRSVVYVVGSIPAPTDSIQLPKGFHRGSKLLDRHLAEIERKTLGYLGYLGEWHSHPNGCVLAQRETE